MLAAVIARQWALALIIAVICLSVAMNDNLLDAPWNMTSAGIFYSSVLMIPFVVFLHSSITTTRAADRLATRSLEVFFSASQQSMLRYLHTNFLGYLHDQVINQLRAVSLGITQTDVARESWNKATQNQNDTDQRLVHHLPLSQVIVSWKSTIRAVHPHARITAPPDAPFQKKYLRW
ncbi:hypothetical protein [Corynebacterium cystitidis]|uniref:hypothetical protein n=1 Tax=Corynebacterium cystitidis TaxID=35757 RepID=UPI00211E73D4|nr:hypothetical protein [Corynebacterium cystitidis]